MVKDTYIYYTKFARHKYVYLLIYSGWGYLRDLCSINALYICTNNLMYYVEGRYIPSQPRTLLAPADNLKITSFTKPHIGKFCSVKGFIYCLRKACLSSIHSCKPVENTVNLNLFEKKYQGFFSVCIIHLNFLGDTVLSLGSSDLNIAMEHTEVLMCQ